MKFSQERLEECTDDELNFVECPECGYDDSESSRGITMHFGYNHEGKISYVFRCKECGDIAFGNGQKNTFCSKDCETLDRVGTLKHQNEDFLRKRIEEDGVRAVDIAQELDVDKNVVWKWVDKYDIGEDYLCPSCDESFATKQGVSKHHTDSHDESISGTEYTCEFCGEENWTPHSPNSSNFPKYCNDDCFGKSMQGEKNPNKYSERREKISEGLLNAYSEGRREPGGRKPFTVEETGHKVDSSWERDVDILLHNLDVEYQYNGQGQYKRYDIGNFTHAPDFVIPQSKRDIIVEVKGSLGFFHQEGKMKKIASDLTQRDNVIYILYGDTPNLDSDVFIEYGKENELKEVILSEHKNYEKESIFDY
jgi:Zn ribbon nucleic-acid-binding protein